MSEPTFAAAEHVTYSALAMRPTGRKAPTDVRISNMSLLLKLIHAEEDQSRATLAQRTGLSKATVSTLMGELLSRGLVEEGGQKLSGSVGRPRTVVRVRPDAVAAVGIDIGPDSLHATIIDLAGAIIEQIERPLDARHLPPEETIQHAADLAVECVHLAVRRGSVAHTIALAPTGVIDTENGVVRFSSPLNWQDVPILDIFRGIIQRATERRCKIPNVTIENDAKLAAWAIYSQYPSHSVDNLLYLSANEGLSAGIVADGKIQRGWLGEAGNMGHIRVEGNGAPCRCGRRGCLETLLSLDAITGLYPADHPVNAPGLTQWDRGKILRQCFDAGEQPLRERLCYARQALLFAMSMMVDVLNPQVIVLSGWMDAFKDILVPTLSTYLEERQLDPSARVRVEMSPMGPWAPSLGAAQAALNPVLDDPMTIEQKLHFPPRTAAQTESR